MTSVNQSLPLKKLPSNTIQNYLYQIQTVQERDIEIRWITAVRKSRTKTYDKSKEFLKSTEKNLLVL